MTSSKQNKVINALNSAGKSTLKGVGMFAGAAIATLGAAAEIQKRDEIREKLSVIADYDLAIAAEIIQSRIDKK